MADDPVTGRGLTYAAAAINPHTGWQESELPAALHSTLKSANQLDKLTQWLASGSPVPFECILTHTTGAIRLVFTPRLFSQGGRPVPAVSVQCDQAPAHPLTGTGNAQMPPLFNRFPAFVVLVSQDYSIRYANQTFYDMFGDVRHLPCYQHIRGRSEPCNVCAPFDVFETDSLTISEWEHPRAGKAYRTFAYPFPLDDGSPSVLIIGLDISQSLKAQKALSHSEQRYRAITDNLASGIAVIDANGSIQAVNPKISEWFGDAISSGVFVDDLFSLTRPSVAETAENSLSAETAAPPLQSPLEQLCSHPAQSLLKAVLTGSSDETELPLMSLSGERIFRIVVCPIRGEERMAGASILMLDDITERRQAEQSLQRTRKLEAMGTLAGGIAHEINQPLSALQLYASGLEMMLEKQGSIEPELLFKRLSWILREAEKIREIITHMRTVVLQEETPNCGPVVVEDAINSALGLVGAQLQSHNIFLKLDFGADVPIIFGNAVQLEQVVINLVINAMHALDSIDILDKTIHIRTSAAESGMARLEVEDNGPGLQGLEERIFDPFFTTKEAGSGMGLGLSIVHAFVETWGGSVQAEDLPPPKQGARFAILLKPVGVPDADNDH
ncbi:PAS domain-containing sensor histidine kinase [Oleidesulfovibrio sp.]|uniref:PAS domain-containing sensor histidine kinase n=1 Tax=Oleidesulfovibrio sp. TaxID=2909707 RepID=UPI003A8C5369